MNRILKHFAVLLFVISLPSTLYACTESGTVGRVPDADAIYGESGVLLIDAYQKLTEGRFNEAIEIFSVYREHIDNAIDNVEDNAKNSGNIVLEIGMGKAYFGAGDYMNAVKSFRAAYSIDAGRGDVIHYLGEAQMRSGAYSDSVETFKILLGRDPDNAMVLGKLEQALRKNRDFAGLYLLFLDRLESVDAGNIINKNYCLKVLLEAAQLMKDKDLILQTVGKFKNTPREFAVETGFEAYELFISGNEEAASATIFDARNIDALVESAGRDGLYFGEYDDSGQYHGKGLIIFGSDNRSSVCRIYYGGFSRNKPNGAGTGYSGYFQEFRNGAGNSIVNKENNYIESDWIDGVPDGIVVKTYEYLEYSDDVLQYSGKIIETATYADAMAQGEVWSENRENTSGALNKTGISYTKHVVADGQPVPFEVTVRGKTVMAYEAYYKDPKGVAFDARTEECLSCIFHF